MNYLHIFNLIRQQLQTKKVDYVYNIDYNNNHSYLLFISCQERLKENSFP